MCWLPALGLNIALWEFLLTSVYQFYFLGFSLSMIMSLTSGVYLFLKYRDYKIWENAQNETDDSTHLMMLTE